MVCIAVHILAVNEEPLNTCDAYTSCTVITWITLLSMSFDSVMTRNIKKTVIYLVYVGYITNIFNTTLKTVNFDFWCLWLYLPNIGVNFSNGLLYGVAVVLCPICAIFLVFLLMLSCIKKCMVLEDNNTSVS